MFLVVNPSIINRQTIQCSYESDNFDTTCARQFKIDKIHKVVHEAKCVQSTLPSIHSVFQSTNNSEIGQ